MNILFVILFLAVCVLNLFVLRGSGWVCAHNLFIVFNGVMGAGILFPLDYTDSVDLAHATVVLLTAILYFLSSSYFAGVFKLRSVWSTFKLQSVINADFTDFSFSAVIYCVSLSAAIMYFYLVGYNVLLTLLVSGLSDIDATELRLASYSGDQYFAPGYFNQFKNVLLPWAFISITAMLLVMRKSSRGRTVLVGLLAVPVVICLLGTGQRAPLVFFLITSFIAVVLFTRDRIRVRTKVKVLLYSLAGFFLFSFMSVALGRSEDSFQAAVASLLGRIFNAQQLGDIVGFRYVYGLPVQMGAEWYADFVGILPSRQGSELSHIVHGIIFGSERGTAPVTLWTSVFYNWGWPGVLVFPILLGVLYTSLTRFMLRRSRFPAPQIVTIAFVSFYLASWVASGPMQLVNNGLVAVITVQWLFRVWRVFRAQRRMITA